MELKLTQEWYVRLLRRMEEEGIEEPGGIMAVSPEIYAEMMRQHDEEMLKDKPAEEE